MNISQKYIFKIYLLALFYFSGQALQFYGKKLYSGEFIPYLKSKFGNNRVNEDAYATSPYAIALADGLGGTKFHSGYIAERITKSFIKEFIKYTPDSIGYKNHLDIGGLTAEVINKSLDEYTNFMNKIIRTHKQKTSQKIDHTIFVAASTFVAGILEKRDGADRLRIIQRGDSLAAVFRKKYTDKIQGIFYYKLIYFSAEQQQFFNGPLNIGENDVLENESFTQESFGVQKGDITIFGTDGFFDNIHLSVLTYMVNFMVAASKLKLNRKNVINHFHNLKFYFSNFDKVKWSEPKKLSDKILIKNEIREIKEEPKQAANVLAKDRLIKSFYDSQKKKKTSSKPKKRVLGLKASDSREDILQNNKERSLGGGFFSLCFGSNVSSPKETEVHTQEIVKLKKPIGNNYNDKKEIVDLVDEINEIKDPAKIITEMSKQNLSQEINLFNKKVENQNSGNLENKVPYKVKFEEVLNIKTAKKFAKPEGEILKFEKPSIFDFDENDFEKTKSFFKRFNVKSPSNKPDLNYHSLNSPANESDEIFNDCIDQINDNEIQKSSDRNPLTSFKIKSKSSLDVDESKVTTDKHKVEIKTPIILNEFLNIKEFKKIPVVKDSSTNQEIKYEPSIIRFSNKHETIIPKKNSNQIKMEGLSNPKTKNEQIFGNTINNFKKLKQQLEINESSLYKNKSPLIIETSQVFTLQKISPIKFQEEIKSVELKKESVNSNKKKEDFKNIIQKSENDIKLQKENEIIETNNKIKAKIIETQKVEIKPVILEESLENLWEIFELRGQIAMMSFKKCSMQDKLEGTGTTGRSESILPVCFENIFSETFNFSDSEFDSFEKTFDPIILSSLFAETALKFSESTNYVSGFCVSSYRYSNNFDCRMGKPDDITVVVNMLKEENNEVDNIIGEINSEIEKGQEIWDSQLLKDGLQFLRYYGI